MGSILTATVGMMDQAWLRPVLVVGLLQRTDDELFGHSLSHLEVHDLAATQIHDAGQIQPALVRRTIRDVGHLSFIERLRSELSVQQVLVNGQAMLGVGRRFGFLHRAGAKSHFLHPPCNRLFRYLNAFLLECRCDLRASIETARVDEDPVDLLLQLLALLGSHLTLFFIFQPCVITASGNLKYLAHLRDTELEAVIVDKNKDQRRSFTK